MTQPIQVTIGCFGCSEEATYCEDFGPLAETIDAIGTGTAPATISPELAEAIRQARAFMASSATPVRYVNLSDNGLDLDWEALLGEFRNEYEGVRVWRHGTIDWYTEHKHNSAANAWFEINLPEGF